MKQFEIECKKHFLSPTNRRSAKITPNFPFSTSNACCKATINQNNLLPYIALDNCTHKMPTEKRACPPCTMVICESFVMVIFCNLVTLHFAATCLWAFCNCSALHIFCITYLCQSLLHMHKFSVIPNQKSNVSLIGPPLNQSGLTHWVRGYDEKSTRKGPFYFSGEHCLLVNPQTLSLDFFR